MIQMKLDLEPSQENSSVRLTTRGLLKLSGLHPRELHNFRHDWGCIQPLVAGRRGKYQTSYWSLWQACVLAIARRAVDDGLTHRAAGHLVRVLTRLTEQDVEASIAAGRRYLMLLNDDVYPRLVDRETVEGQPAELLHGLAVVKQTLRLVDVGLALQQCREDLRVLQLQAAKAREANPGARAIRPLLDPATA